MVFGVLFGPQIDPVEQARRRALVSTPSRRALVREVIDREIEEVDRLSFQTMQAIYPVLIQAQRELELAIPTWIATRPDGDVRFTPHSYRNALAQIDVLRKRIEGHLSETLIPGAEQAQQMALRHLVFEVGRFSELFEGSTRRVSLNVAAQIATGQAYIIPRIRTSAARYAGKVGEDIKRNLAVAILRGQPVSELVDRLVDHGGPRGLVALRGIVGDPGAVVENIPEGLFRRYRYWAERVVRTETQSAYNAQLLEGLHEARTQVPGLLKRWNTDGAGCDRICKPIDEQVQPLDKPFATPVGPVEHAPAHPNCRCRSGAWKEGWDAILRDANRAPPTSARTQRPPQAIAPAVTPTSAPTPPTPPPRVPKGTAVANGLHIPPSPQEPNFAPRIRAAIATLDSVHGDGVLPTIPVNYTTSKKKLGTYWHMKVSHNAHSIDVSRAGSHPELTIIHEVGHFLDHQAIGKKKFASEDTKHTAFDEWRAAIAASRAHGELQALLSNPLASQKHTNYMLEGRELWARSYAQYIAVRSQSPVLLKQLDAVRNRGTGVYYPKQWDDQDFEPIAKAIDELLLNLGWRV